MTDMTTEQTAFLANMTDEQATALLAKFNDDPAIAEAKSAVAYAAFNQAWERLHNEYWQRANLAGGIRYSLVGLGDDPWGEHHGWNG